MKDNRERLTGYMSIASLALLLLPFAWVILQLIARGVPDFTNAGDGALLEMSTRNLFRDRILLGPYSRFLFFHPGPMYFYLRYPLYALSGWLNGSFLITVVLIAAGCLYGCWKFAGSRLGDLPALVFAFLASLFLHLSDHTMWMSEWNPFIIMFPMVLYCVAAAALAAGSFSALYVMVICGSFVAQTHIGGIPSLAALLAAALACLFFRGLISSDRELSWPWKHVLISGIILAVLWLPPLYEQFTAEEMGNMSRIQEFFDTHDPDVTFSEAFQSWKHVVTTVEITPLAGSLRQRGLAEPFTLGLVAVRLLLLSVSYGLLRRFRLSPFLCALNIVCVVLHGMTLYSVTQIRGEVNPYLIQWMQMTSLVSAFAVVLSAWLLIRRTGKRKKTALTAAALLLALSIPLAVGNLRDASGFIRYDIHPSWTEVVAADDLSRQTAGAIYSLRERTFSFELVSPSSWAVFFGVMNALEKEGCSIAIAENMWYPARPAPEGAETASLLMGFIEEQYRESPDVVAMWQDIGIVLR